MKKVVVGVLLLALVAGGLFWMLGRGPTGGGSSDAPLSFVPADSPYVFANFEPLPGPVVEKAMQQSAEVMGMYGELFDSLRVELEASEKPEDKRILAMLDALIAEFDNKTPQQINDSLGIGLDGRIALYGIGMVPVLRMDLAKPDNLRAFIGRMEKAAGAEMTKAKLEALEYWVFQPEAAPLMGVGAIIGNQLVLTLAPAQAEPAVLRVLLGVDKPAKSVLDSGSLQALNKDYKFTPYFSGYLDSAKLIAAYNANSAVDQAFLKALGTEKPQIDATCSKELSELATAWPRMVVGYEVFEPTRNVSRFVFETRSDIASELLKLRAPMPGLGKASEAAMLNFGLSFKLSAVPGVVNAFAGKVAESPWECAQLADLNQAFDEAKTGINNPAVFAAAPVFSGLHLILNTLEMDFASGATPSGSGALLIGSDNPASLIGMAKGFVPQLATLEIPTDGSVVALPAMPGVPPELQAHAASSDKVIGIGVGGDDIKAALPSLLQADPNQQPLFVMGLSSGFYVKLADAMAASAEMTSDGDPKAAELLKKQAELMRELYTKLFDRIDYRIELSERGIEFHQTVTSH